MVNLFKTIRDRLGMGERVVHKHTYIVEFGIFHDGIKVSNFNMEIKANSREHAWRILANYVEVKPITLRPKANAKG
jgi:hypothetical protein